MRIYSVDDAIRKNRPYVELRGRLYRVRDFTVRERLEKILEFKERQEEAERKAEESGEDISFDQIQEVIAEAISQALEDVPEEVAKSITQTEWDVLQAALQQIQSASFPVEVREEEEIDPKKVGAATG